MQTFWSLKTIAAVWSAVAVLTLIFCLLSWMNGAPLLAGLWFPGFAAVLLIVFSLIMRGTDGWGWIPVGLVLAVLWQLLRLLLILLRFVGTARVRRHGGWD